MDQHDGSPFEPLGAGSLLFDAGFTFELDQAGLDGLTSLFAGATFDPDLDEQIANERCPSCAQRFADLAPGHAWSLDMSTRQYRCSGPVIPGEVIARREEPR